MATLKERERRTESMETESEVFQLFEGCCPTCKGDVEVVSAGGITKFQQQQTWLLELPIEFNYWCEDASLDFTIIGGVQFKCEDGHKHYIELNKFGDWA